MPGNEYLARYLRYLVLQERASKIVKNTTIGLKFFVVGQNKNLLPPLLLKLFRPTSFKLIFSEIFALLVFTRKLL